MRVGYQFLRYGLQVFVYPIDGRDPDAFGTPRFGGGPNDRDKVTFCRCFCISVHFHKKLLTTQGAGIAVVAGGIHRHARRIEQGVHLIFQVRRIKCFFLGLDPAIVKAHFKSIFPEDVIILIPFQVIGIGFQQALNPRRNGVGLLCNCIQIMENQNSK